MGTPRANAKPDGDQEGTPAFLVGFAAEARIARRGPWPVAVGGGTTEGARRAALRLVEAGATALVSFGLAGGLDPALPAGALIVAGSVVAEDGACRATDPGLNLRLGGASSHRCLGLDRVVASAAEKRRLGRETGAALADMESAAVAAVAAAHGVPFAVVRAVCDPVDRSLPPAALVALDAEGRIRPLRLAASLLRSPRQMGGLLRLAGDAAAARRALAGWIAGLA